MNIFTFLSSLSSQPSKKIVSSSVTNSNKKKSPKEESSTENTTENDLPSPKENDSIYYLPVHLM